MRTLTAVCLVTALVVCACGGRDGDLSTPEGRARAVKATVVEHLEHELAMLALLEQHRNDPPKAEDALTSYVREHQDALRRLSERRALLETEPLALARALESQRERHTSAFKTRQRLELKHPALMESAAVRAALASLDDL